MKAGDLKQSNVGYIEIWEKPCVFGGSPQRVIHNAKNEMFIILESSLTHGFVRVLSSMGTGFVYFAYLNNLTDPRGT